VQAGAASQYDTIKLINYIRAQAASGAPPAAVVAELEAAAAAGERPWGGDAHLTPVLPDDELLLHEWESDDEGGPAAAAAALAEENEGLRAALAALQELAVHGDGLRSLLLAERGAAGGAAEAPTPAPAPGAPSPAAPPADAASAADAAASRVDAAYFDSYSFFDIHREMLSDRARTEAYRLALERNPALIRGATVLDVGCGTGVLSLFAARGGAARVVAVDGSPAIAGVARAVCAANGHAEGGAITVVSSRVEEMAELPGGGKADVLVSEWMGAHAPLACPKNTRTPACKRCPRCAAALSDRRDRPCAAAPLTPRAGYALLFESMLDSVLVARDRFLKPGGAVLPDVARIFVAAAGEGATGLGFWNDVYGLSMAPVAESLRQTGARPPRLCAAHAAPRCPQHRLTFRAPLCCPQPCARPWCAASPPPTC
jgi:protein arginine N-methyltransferase 3